MDRKQELKEEIKTLQRELSAIYKVERAEPYFESEMSWTEFADKLLKLQDDMNLTGRVIKDKKGYICFNLHIHDTWFESRNIPKLVK